MPLDNNNLNVAGRGRSNREVVLNEIKEARRELQKLSQTLQVLEQIVASKPDTGVVKVEDRMASPLITLDQIWPLTGWILSLYESFYMIGRMALGRDYAAGVSREFSKLITNVNAVSITLGK